MMDAPERIWVGTDGEVVLSRDAFLNVGGYPVEYVRADLYQASQNALWERDEQWQRKVAALEQQRDVAVQAYDSVWDCNATLRTELARLREIVEMAWKGYGYDQEWDCDCPVCAAIRTRALAGEGE